MACGGGAPFHLYFCHSARTQQHHTVGVLTSEFKVVLLDTDTMQTTIVGTSSTARGVIRPSAVARPQSGAIAHGKKVRHLVQT